MPVYLSALSCDVSHVPVHLSVLSCDVSHVPVDLSVLCGMQMVLGAAKPGTLALENRRGSA
jgi:hypothetical protein